MTQTRRSGSRRGLIVAIGLSLALHGVLGWAVFVADRGAEDGRATEDGDGPPMTLTLGEFERRKEPEGSHEQEVVTERDFAVTLGTDVATVAFPAAGTAVDAAPVVSPRKSGSPGTGSGPARGSPGLLAPTSGAARRIVYLLDCSGSMGPSSGALARARREIYASLRSLPVDARFQILLYDTAVHAVSPGGLGGWLAADSETLGLIVQEVDRRRAGGAGTDHFRALADALALNPDVVYLLTDAGDLTKANVEALIGLNGGGARIHAVELNSRETTGVLRRLADASGGSYRRVAP